MKERFKMPDLARDKKYSYADNVYLKIENC